MSSCEICGENADTQRVQLHGAMLQACSKCRTSMGLKSLEDTRTQSTKPRRTGGSPRKYKAHSFGGDIMDIGNDILANDFARRIKNAREARGWDQKTLARQMMETVNVVKRAESGTRPTDNVVGKFERTLGITLMETDDD